MNIFTRINVKWNYLQSSTSRQHRRKPVLEALEGRALLSASHATLNSGFGSQVAAIQFPPLSHGANVSLAASSAASSKGPTAAMLALTAGADDDDPPPDPEPAPPVNPINGPIQYPTLPPSGPLGPG